MDLDTQVHNMINLIIGGSSGRMGKTVIEHFKKNKAIKIIEHFDKDDDLLSLDLKTADVYIDLTHPESVVENIKFFSHKGIDCVIGTSGISGKKLEDIRKIQSKNKNTILVAPNFSLGACLMIKFSKIAKKYFSQAEIIELHHDEKKDRPSGTALYTSKECNIPEDRIHSIRLKGLLAHQQVMFGGSGETLTIKHDSMDRSSFMNGIELAVKEVYNQNNTFIMGLENILL